MRRALLLGVVLAGCKGEQADADARSWKAADYLPAPGTMLEYIPHEQPDAEPMFLRAAKGEWELRAGVDWDHSEAVELWEVDTAGGLTVDGAAVLPATVEEGASFDNGTVTAVGDVEVWYGTFYDAVTVEVASGPLSGLVSFGQGVGPIALQVGAYPWELASYEVE